MNYLFIYLFVTSLLTFSYHLYNIHKFFRLQISRNGNVELVFEYDSDWSDLADDEEPDSNDERFAGNDYPEEGEGKCTYTHPYRHFSEM